MSKKKKQKLSLRSIIGIGLSILFIITLIGAVKWANYRQSFEVSNIAISGNKILEKSTYEAIVSAFEVTSINRADLRKMAQAIEENPFVKAAQVSRHFPNKMNINIVERDPLAIINLADKLMIDGEGVVLPNHAYSNEALIPILSGFNPSTDLYPHGEPTFSVKVKEAVAILKQLSNGYPELYENISELTLNNDEEYVIILSDRPTRVVLGKDDIITKLNILKNFDTALGQRQLTDFRLLDMRYKKQLVAREWT
ncbi:MAG: FtsQ-type POTRA domain-containing protein [Candidatus Marinimicrobia bacterium]|nr:FtsQ-type POTRA domain-containing protein [Candidatus Neomarinimicrobiota bacterium]MDD9887569.1 FtsQ-type POTRA domain-containing protein [Candidatus Neomarinimicrobiota bacterium]MDD9930433.1 FtsQ-type POTRA domain-containing protein [Candidatus Neomarinimicrobiota bacterium]